VFANHVERRGIMWRVTRWRQVLAPACLLVAAWAGPVLAQDTKPGAAAKEPSQEQRISDALRDVINRGADLYNSGDHSGCYRLFQGSLMTVRAQLTSYPALLKEIANGMAEAEQRPSVSARAFVLRKVLDDIRSTVNPKKPSAVAPAGGGLPAATLWDRLGGDASVRKVVDDFVALASADPKVNFDRNGKYKLDAAGVNRLKQELVDFVSATTGGPFKYTGKAMKAAHAGMAITDAEFNAIATDLKTALENHGAKPGDVKAVLEAVEGTRKDIVEGGKPKKSEEKKPPGTKPGD
jgi:hemoglobin